MSKPKTFNFRHGWVLGWIGLIILSIVSLVNVSKDTCGTHIPILLSRALTTEPYRGICLVFCLFAAISSVYLNSIILTISFFGFFSAFLVSMFSTPTTHDAFIFFSAMLVMYECIPTNNNVYWRIHWWGTFFIGCVCAGFFLYIVFGCRAPSYDGPLPLPEDVYCERCSWWFITEYLTFWSMFMLVWWKIDPKLKWHDKIYNISEDNPPDNKETDGLLSESKNKLNKSESQLNF